ncbi:hypothetical protein BBP40_004109 [Aspergillus hancockii]|nr:hypothetical protein BBP40_004109 [Aspergillus hancockii]
MHDKQFEAIRGDTLSTAAASVSRRDLNKANPENQELVALFADSDTPAVSEALDKLGIPGQAFGLNPLTNYKKGYRWTSIHGDVVVIDNDGRTDCTVWGDIMTQYAGLRGIAGSVIDSVCRDMNRAINDDYPLFTAGRWMRTGKDRVQVGGINESIGIGKVRVKPRDIVVADANGVVIVPRD